MSSISSLSKMVSALMSSQQALNTTAHNLTNVDTEGYVRQQVMFNDSTYSTIGQNAISTLSVGMGVDIDSIYQVRDIFLDQSYREEIGRMGFYEAQAEAVNEIETILGETEGEAFSEIMDDLWTSINELAKQPDGLETRANFIQNAVVFVEKANLIMEQINDYQSNMNGQVETMVDRINEIGAEIDSLNDTIRKEELTGGNANDYRDQRNLLLDELSGLVNTSYREGSDGTVYVNIENVPFVISGSYFEMGLTQSEPLSDLVEPYWPHLDTTVFNSNNPTGPEYDNDIGELKGLIMARGSRQANYTDMATEDSYESIESSVIMQAQAQFDNLIHGVVTMVNNLVSPNTDTDPAYLDTANAPYGLDGSQGTEVFVRKYVTRYDETTGEYIEEDPDNPNTLYSAGNIEVNSDLLADYDLLCLSVTSGYDGDTTIIQSILDGWDAEFSTLEPGSTGEMDFTEYYNAFIGSIGNIGSVATAQVENQSLMSTQIDNQRLALIGVSSDEELGNMMKYQHAYNAASRVLTVMDSMLEQVVTSLGVVGR